MSEHLIHVVCNICGWGENILESNLEWRERFHMIEHANLKEQFEEEIIV